ncbi:hypothetical protein ANO11243_045340 [Dothideomycetidae sp. 11243]|nr:hypothetical protein ANO11243_045340 [fungal sp. No.11243]
MVRRSSDGAGSLEGMLPTRPRNRGWMSPPRGPQHGPQTAAPGKSSILPLLAPPETASTRRSLFAMLSSAGHVRVDCVWPTSWRSLACYSAFPVPVPRADQSQPTSLSTSLSRSSTEAPDQGLGNCNLRRTWRLGRKRIRIVHPGNVRAQQAQQIIHQQAQGTNTLRTSQQQRRRQ